MFARTRAPLSCGALGSYDLERVLRIADLLGCSRTPVHADESSILLLDRPGIEWGDRRQRGFGWIEGEIWRSGPPVAGWKDAARRGLNGLVLEGRKRFLHTSVNGIAPVYWLKEDGATYFASRIDPLVRSARGPLSVDWQAWAATIALRYPVGERTPFEEVRRLPSMATMRRRRFGGTQIRVETTPWEDTEPRVGIGPASERVVEAMDASLEGVEGEVICPLSGGRDSRLLFCALARDGRVARAITTSDDEGDTHEEALAEPVAAASGVPHERLLGAAVDYTSDWEERARRVEYQFVDHAWLVPVMRRLGGVAAPVPDGFGFDIFFASGRHFYTPETLDYRAGEQANRAMFDVIRRYGRGHRALATEFHAAVESSAREQYLAAVRRYEGHPSQAILSLYATRSLRGVSMYGTALLGDTAPMLIPGAHTDIAVAALEVAPQEKLGGSLYDAVLERLGTPGAMFPSTADTPRRAVQLPRRWCSPQALEGHRRLLSEGPLAGHVSTELHDWLNAPDGIELSGDLRLGMEAVSMFHAWWRRYRDILREVDARDLLG